MSSGSTRPGPLIQRQGYIKRAPSGKLSAFKKWEKKWCVFALSKRCGPVLDFFERKEDTGGGPTAAANRVELQYTKQVCAAIQCKVPYTFIVVTDSRILSLAAVSQSDADAWISCLRRVLTKENCLQSSEDHTYEVGATGLTRQEQERIARSKKRPPTPPSDTDSEEDVAAADENVSEAPPVPPPLSQHPSLVPALSRRISKGPLPPPVPSTSRPRARQDNDTSSNKGTLKPSGEDAKMNMAQVLMNYEESPDTTYEAGDRAAINRAVRTLDHRQLTASLEREQQFAASETSASKSSDPLYTEVKKPKSNHRAPVAPRRASTISRIEHDFSPSLAVLSPTDAGQSASAIGAAVGPQQLTGSAYSSEDEADDVYTCMDSFADGQEELIHITSQLEPANENHYDFDDNDFELPASPLEENLYDALPAPRPVVPPSQLLLPPELPAKKVIHLNNSSNSIADVSTATKESEMTKQYPTAAPRRHHSERRHHAQPKIFPERVTSDLSFKTGTSRGFKPPIPSRREHVHNNIDDQDTYENAMGLFGTGVTTASRDLNKRKTTLTLPSPNMAPQQSVGMSEPLLPRVPKPASNSLQAQSPVAALSIDSTSTSTVNGKVLQSGSDEIRSSLNSALQVNIPIADGESTDSSLTAPVVSPGSISSSNQPEEGSLPCSDQSGLRNQLEYVDKATLPSDEAPPPYTPPRLLNDSQLSNNMDCIAEGNSEEDSEPEYINHADVNKPITDWPVSAAALSNHSEPLYDSHPAFIRHTTTFPHQTDKDGYSNNPPFINSSGSKAPTLPVRKLSPHTPPGTPPLYARVNASNSTSTHPATHLPQNTSYNSPVDDVVHRLEDSFPRMKQTKYNRRPKSHLENVVMVSPNADSSSKRTRKSAFRKSFNVPMKLNDEEMTPVTKPVAPPRSSSSTDKLDSTTAEYDHIIRQKSRLANQRMVRAGSSSDDSDPGVARRRRKPSITDIRQRRKSAPPNSLDIKLLDLSPSTAAPSTPPVSASSNQLANASSAGAGSPVKPKERRYSRLPLPGGTLLKDGKVFKAAQREENSKSILLKQAQTEILQREIAHYHGVRVTVWRKALKHVLFVEIMNYIWVAGWNQKECPLLCSIFHIGDKVLSVNNETFTSTAKLMKFIKRSDRDAKFEIVLRRLPFGKTYFIHRNIDYESIGLEIRDSSAEVIGIEKGSLVAQQGLRINPNKAFGPGQCHWTVTEVNHRPLALIAAESDAKTRLTAVGKDVSFVVQPLDFIELLKKALKSATFSWKDYLVS